MIDIEICVDSVESSIAAELGGAHRIELCSALSEGGMTPSSGLIQTVREAVTLDLFVIIRPRGGNFTYSPKEFEVMRRDVRNAQSLGANGLVFGLLTSDGQVDRDRTRLLVEDARPLAVTFHRAFDACNDLDRALEEVISSGASRLLTSGGCSDAVSGMRRIARLREAAGNRIRIMAGGGVRTSNVAALVEGTGIRDVHTSLNSKGARPEIQAASRLPQIGIFDPFIVTEEDVRSFKSAVDSISAGPVSAGPASADPAR
jgi:copper homeostasis protein